MPARRPQRPKTPMTTPILVKVMGHTVLLAAFIIVSQATLSAVMARQLILQEGMSRVSVVASAAKDSLERQSASARERTSFVGRSDEVKSVLAGKSGSVQGVQRLFALEQRDAPSLLGMTVYGSDGKVLMVAGEPVPLPQEARIAPFHRSVIDVHTWKTYDVFTPVWASGGKRIGYVLLRYDPNAFFVPVLPLVQPLGDSARLQLAFDRQGNVVVVEPRNDPATQTVSTLVTEPPAQLISVVQGVHGEEGVQESKEADGRSVLAGFRYMPDVNWGLAVTLDRSEALRYGASLVFSHAMLGILFLLFTVVLSYVLAKQLTEPLRNLALRVTQLRPGHWQLGAGVHSGDEVQVLDSVLGEMAQRLKRTYAHQQEEIESRTAELKQQYVLDRAILQNIKQSVMTFDRLGIVTAANAAALQLLSRKEDAVIGKLAAKVLTLRGHRGNALRGLHPVMQCVKNKQTVIFDINDHLSLELSDGTLLPILLAVTPLKSDEGTFGAIAVFQDVAEARKVDYLKTEFISLASHQLRTPISAMRWYVELFAEEKKKLSEDQVGYLGEMDHALKRMVALLNSLLHAAHLEEENMAPEIRNVQMQQLLGSMQKDLESVFSEAKVRCDLKLPKTQIEAHTDPTLLRIVLQNLVSNAVKYSPRHSAVTIALAKKQKGIKIVISDHGMGIPKGEQHRVFEKFFRATNVRKVDTDGNGLGLYITRSMVLRLGGTISFVSIEGKGTTFVVWLPLLLKKAKKSKS